MEKFAIGVGMRNWPCISATVEDRTKVSIGCLYKVIHDLSIGANMYDIE